MQWFHADPSFHTSSRFCLVFPLQLVLHSYFLTYLSFQLRCKNKTKQGFFELHLPELLVQINTKTIAKVLGCHLALARCQSCHPLQPCQFPWGKNAISTRITMKESCISFLQAGSLRSFASEFPSLGLCFFVSRCPLWSFPTHFWHVSKLEIGRAVARWAL